MNARSHTRKRSAVVIVAAAAVAVLVVPTASAKKSGSSGVVAAILGSQDARNAARAGNTEPVLRGVSDFGLAERSIRAELGGPVRPDGAALRPYFNELAAQAASSQTARLPRSGASRAVPASSGFSWRDAGIGGGVALFLVAVVALGFAVATHSRKKELASA